jgi:hypothetical protein
LHGLRSGPSLPSSDLAARIQSSEKLLLRPPEEQRATHLAEALRPRERKKVRAIGKPWRRTTRLIKLNVAAIWLINCEWTRPKRSKASTWNVVPPCGCKSCHGSRDFHAPWYRELPEPVLLISHEGRVSPIPNEWALAPGHRLITPTNWASGIHTRHGAWREKAA